MNQQFFLFLNNLAEESEISDMLIVFFAQYLIFIMVIGVLFFIFRNNGKDFYQKLIIIFGGAVLAWIISQGINILYPVARPFLVFPEAHLLFTHGEYDSFPSGHATLAFALAFGFFYYNKPLAWFFLVGAFLIGVSRVIAGVHWPLDIMGAFLFAGITIFLVHLVLKIFQK